MNKSILTISLGAGLALSASLAFGLGVEGNNSVEHLTGKSSLGLSSLCTSAGTTTIGNNTVNKVDCTLNNHSQSATLNTIKVGSSQFQWHHYGSQTIVSKYVAGAFYSTIYARVVRCYGGTWSIINNNTTAVCKYGN